MAFFKTNMSRSARYFWLTLGAFTLFSIAFVCFLDAEQEINRAHERRFKSFLLADELRHSSDDLTRMARSYVATGHPIYRKHYHEIIDIRDGHKPRPINAYSVYWDLVLEDDVRPRPFAGTVPLLELMRINGFTKAEFAKLAESKSASDSLLKTELDAMALVESKESDNGTDRLAATDMLQDTAYHQAKADIMRPIGKFYDMVAVRTLRAIKTAVKYKTRMGVLVVLLGILLVFLLWGLEGALKQEKQEKARSDALNERLKKEIEGRQKAVDALKESEGRFRFIAESTFDVIWTMDLFTMRFTYVSPSIKRLLGFTPQEIISTPLLETLTPESAKRISSALDNTKTRWESGERPRTTHVTEVEQPHKDGHTITTEVITTMHADDSGRLVSVLGVTRDITKRKKEREAIRRLAFYDGLTQLPNRRLLLDRLPQTLARAKRDNSRIALLFIDLDRFKPVNDALGHQVGDWLLQKAAKRMMDCLRPYDTAARIGGDEFIILLPDLHQIDDAMIVAERIRTAMEQPFVTPEGLPLEVTSSIGIALYPDHATNERELLRIGDEAMYRAKRHGSNKVEIIPVNQIKHPTSIPPASSKEGGVRLTWNPALNSGDTVIDNDMRYLLRVASRLLNNILKPQKVQDRLQTDFNSLLTGVSGVLKQQEAILVENGSPHLDEHSNKQRALLDQGDILRQKVESNSVTPGELFDFLAENIIVPRLWENDMDNQHNVDPEPP